MKKILLFLGLAVLLVACAGPKLTPQEKALQRAKIAQSVLSGIANRHFKIEVSHMRPMGGATRSLSYGYFVEVKGDTLISALPYFGRAYQVTYGRESGLNFTGQIADYTVSQPKKDLTHIDIHLRVADDEFHYIFEIFTNGKTDLVVRSRNRDQIGFTGDMNLEGR